MHLKILIRESPFHVSLECWDRNAPSNSPKAPGTKSKFWKERGPSRGIIQKCAPHERSPGARKFGERCARKAAWDLAKNIYKLKNSDRTTFHTPIEAKVMLAPTSTRPEEREFAADPGAPTHMMSRKESSSGEMDTVERSRTSTVVLTANGEVHTLEGNKFTFTTSISS